MRSYQPERSLYAALWCVTHVGMQACRRAGMQVGIGAGRAHAIYTHTPHYFSLNRVFTGFTRQSKEQRGKEESF